MSYVEHSNMTVKDLDKTTEFLLLALPDWRIRGGSDGGDRRWRHVGNDTSYIALEEAREPGDLRTIRKFYRQEGINHIGIVVEDVDAVTARLEAAGFTHSIPTKVNGFRKRTYFYDSDTVEWEFIQYTSDKMEERNSYTEEEKEVATGSGSGDASKK